MSVVKRIGPPPSDPVDRPRCTAHPNEPLWLREAGWRAERFSKNGHDPKCCQRFATVEIDGRPYCNQHAGAIVLEERLREPQAEIIWSFGGRQQGKSVVGLWHEYAKRRSQNPTASVDDIIKELQQLGVSLPMEEN